MVSATEEHQRFPLLRVARHHFTDDDRVVSALMHFSHLAIKPRERVFEHRTFRSMVAGVKTVAGMKQRKR